MIRMSAIPPPSAEPKRISRLYAIRRLREYLLTLTDDDHSMCEVAAKKGIFCKGFQRWNDGELRKHFAGLVKRRPGMNRWQLEALGNKWELARQIVDGAALACDAQTLEHDTCGGWDDFSNEELSRYCAELLGLDAIVTEIVT